MKTAVFSAHQFEREYLETANAGRHEVVFLDARLSEDTCPLAEAAGQFPCLSMTKPGQLFCSARHQLTIISYTHDNHHTSHQQKTGFFAKS